MKAVNGIVLSVVAVALAGCGAEEIASPGNGGDITINNPPPVVQEPAAPDPAAELATPAGGCPTIAVGNLRDDGTISGPTGEYRVCTLPAQVTGNITLERLPGVLYALDGKTQVGADLGVADGSGVTLTIQPGVVIFARTGTSWLLVNRGNKLNAVGTAAQPIVFTSRDNVLGLATDTSHGQWGGVVLNGRAPVTDCALGTAGSTDPASACQRYVEGDVDNAVFGGLTSNDSSGVLDYVQIRYSGYVLAANVELQSLTLNGVGSGTTIRHFQSHNSSDDGFENFGGTVDMRYLVLTGADDDSIDVDTGYTGTIQYVIAAQKGTGGGDSVIELDSANAMEAQLPRTFLKLANFTLLHRNPATGNGAALRLRGQANVALVNGLVTSPMACLMVEKPEFLLADAGTEKVVPTFQTVAMSCGGAAFRGVTVSGSAVTDMPQVTSDLATIFNADANNNAALASTLTGGFINGAAESALVAVDPKAMDPRFDTTTYVGAVRDAADTWYAGWTCNSATASFGAGSTSCTSLPSLK